MNQCYSPDCPFHGPNRTCSASDGCGGYTTPTNADHIRNMTDTELAEFISQVELGRLDPWDKQFNAMFCKKCPAEAGSLAGYRKEVRLHECDFVGGVCPHGDEIMWWLQQPAEVPHD